MLPFSLAAVRHRDQEWKALSGPPPAHECSQCDRRKEEWDNAREQWMNAGPTTLMIRARLSLSWRAALSHHDDDDYIDCLTRFTY